MMAREMKDSGIEWIGEIPKEWELPKVKYLFSIGRGRVISQLELEEYGYPVYSSQTKNNGCLGYISTYDFDRSQLTWTTDGANAGTVFLREGKHNCTNVCGTLMPKNDDNNLLFLKYALEYIAVYHKRADINGYKIMNNEMADIVIVLPPLPEQEKIATFLDSECAKIDEVISKTKSTIEEYKKLKQSVITEAVTKGIRPNREMKDSGIEWIGEICTDYAIYRLKHLLRTSLMYGANDSGIPFDETLPRYIRITDITLDGKLKDEGKLSLSEESASPYILEDDDILFARSGATVGKAFIYKKEYGKSAFAGYLIKASTNNRVIADYVFYYTQSSIYEEWKKQIFIQATIQNIGADRYSNLPIVIPNVDEQEEIANYLDKKCTEIDTLIAKKEQIVSELESYKKSLIYEYVTGKKEVV